MRRRVGRARRDGGKHVSMSCLRIVRHSQITSLVVVDDDDKPIGLLRLLDAPGAGLRYGGAIADGARVGGHQLPGAQQARPPDTLLF